jgi:hypothetical protein
MVPNAEVVGGAAVARSSPALVVVLNARNRVLERVRHLVKEGARTGIEKASSLPHSTGWGQIVEEGDTAPDGACPSM